MTVTTIWIHATVKESAANKENKILVFFIPIIEKVTVKIKVTGRWYKCNTNDLIYEEKSLSSPAVYFRSVYYRMQ